MHKFPKNVLKDTSAKNFELKALESLNKVFLNHINKLDSLEAFLLTGICVSNEYSYDTCMDSQSLTSVFDRKYGNIISKIMYECDKLCKNISFVLPEIKQLLSVGHVTPSSDDDFNSGKLNCYIQIVRDVRRYIYRLTKNMTIELSDLIQLLEELGDCYINQDYTDTNAPHFNSLTVQSLIFYITLLIMKFKFNSLYLTEDKIYNGDFLLSWKSLVERTSAALQQGKFSIFKSDFYSPGFFIEFYNHYCGLLNAFKSLPKSLLQFVSPSNQHFTSAIFYNIDISGRFFFQQPDYLAPLDNRSATLPTFGVVTETSVRDLIGSDNPERHIVTLREFMIDKTLYVVSRIKYGNYDSYVILIPSNGDIILFQTLYQENVKMSSLDAYSCVTTPYADDLILTIEFYKRTLEKIGVNGIEQLLIEEDSEGLEDSIILSPKNTSDKEETEMIHINGYVRRLPLGQTSSFQALESARNYGIRVEDGYTFVQPFWKELPVKSRFKRVPLYINIEV